MASRIPPLWLRNGIMLLAVVVPLLGTAIAIHQLWNLYVTPLDLALLAGMYVATALGITIGYHRMLTHRGFETSAPVRAFWLVLGSMAVQGPAIEWAATHVKHHAKADTDEDPHSPLAGFFHAHVGWLFRDRMVTHGVWAKPFREDPVTMFVHRTFFAWVALGLLIPAAIGGALAGWSGFWGGLLWGGLVRVFLVHHVTWSVNSVCHTFGKRPFETVDQSRNEWVVGLLALGEGWHNNHHAAPRSAVHGFRWWQFDLSAYVILTLEKLRVVRNVQRPPLAALARRRAAAPDADAGGAPRAE